MTDDEIIERALEILQERLIKPDVVFTSPSDVKNYLTLQLRELEREVFYVLYLNSQHGLIANETLFAGTINAAAIYPREVVKMALQFNAAAVIFAHNHPSGDSAPSEADRAITKRLKQALHLVGIEALDHVVVAGCEAYSFAENYEMS